MSARPRVLVFEHMQAGHAGIFRELLRERGVASHVVRFDRGEPIPDLGGFDALWVMGGPMDVWQEAEHPWLVEEKAAIREAVIERAMPYLGICLGHQLLADALGGVVQPATRPEVGVFEIARTPAGTRHALLDGLPARPRVLQWHAAEVVEPPAGAEVLASSEDCAVQVMLVGEQALGLQFHLEVDDPTLEGWLSIPDNVAALVRRRGREGPRAFVEEARRYMAEFNRSARALHANFWARLLQPRAAR
ncbi:MAG TPA: type 1 glutamine amidotransferase [Geminicoccaceae bacterium]|nr:type 1 glutamine amidotransferase [Geminicoccaceae bacterium]